MRKWLLVLGWVCLMCAAGWAYVGLGDTPNESVVKVDYKEFIDPKFKPYIAKFIEEGKNRGYDYTQVFEDNLEIMAYTKVVEYPTYGRTYHDKNAILIADFVEGDWVMARFVIYHELGHIAAGAMKGHTCNYCNEVMSASTPPTFAPYVGDYWDKKLDNLFNWLDLKRNEELRPVEVECP